VQTIELTAGMSRVQSEFCDSSAAYRSFCGGVGSGKSWVGAFDLLCRAGLAPGRTFMIGSPTGVMMWDTTYPTFKTLAEQFRLWGTVKLTPYPTATLANGAAVRFRTAEDPEKMRGPNLTGVWLDEASLMARAAYDISIARLREAGRPGWLSATFTPKGPTHWTYEAFATGRPDTALFRSRTDENPFLPPEFAATVGRQYGDTQFARQELGGEFVQVAGAEFPAAWFDGPGFWFGDWPPDLAYKVIYLDPSKGRTDKSGDYQAYCMAGLGRDGTVYLDCEMNREPTPDMVARGIRLAREWGPVAALALEDNGTMGFLGPEIARQCKEAGALVPWRLVTNREPKLFRIRSLGGYLSRGQIRVRDTPGGRLMRAQLGDVPFGQFDDGPDAAAGAVRVLEEIAGARR